MNEPLAVVKDHGTVSPPKGCKPIRLDPIAQIYLALLANRADIDLNEIARITGVAGSELSWILAQLVQQNEVSRRKVRRGNESERVEYQLDRRQKERARIYLGAQIPPAIALPWGDRPAALLRALLTSPHDKRRTVAELSAETGISGAELAWRLATLHRDGVVCRGRTTSAGHGYFLEPDQAHRVATWLSAGEGLMRPLRAVLATTAMSRVCERLWQKRSAQTCDLQPNGISSKALLKTSRQIFVRSVRECTAC